MGVYIKGMEMPTSCDECPMFNLDIDGGCYCTKYFVIRKKDQDRPDWCPLVSVPPHGRLMDIDAQYEIKLSMKGKTNSMDVYGRIVLPADPAEEGET